MIVISVFDRNSTLSADMIMCHLQKPKNVYIQLHKSVIRDTAPE